MNRAIAAFIVAGCVAASLGVHAQVTVQADANQEQMLKDPDSRLAANKRLVYDFWREVFEGGHLDRAGSYLAESYIQHNPNVPSGRAGFVDFFSKFSKPKPIQPRIDAPLIAIVADGDLVILSFVSEQPDPKDASKKYTTTWFDMFRIKDAKIVEHWDPSLRQ